jgi:hypothetical protein
MIAVVAFVLEVGDQTMMNRVPNQRDVLDEINHPHEIVMTRVHQAAAVLSGAVVIGIAAVVDYAAVSDEIAV